MRRHFFIALAVSFAVLAAGLLAYYWANLPITLRVAVGPMGSQNTRLVAALSQHLARERHPLRLKLVLTESVAASAKAIDDDKVDLAVVRADVAMPLRARTAVIMHRDAAILMALPRSGIAQVADLKGRSIGVIRDDLGNRQLIATVLSQYEVPQDSVTIVPLDSGKDVQAALSEGRVDAVLAVSTVTGRTMTDAVAGATAAAGGPPVFIPITEADAIEQRLPVLETLEVVRGTFGGNPPRPAETFETVGVSHRLVAHINLDDSVVAELTRLIFSLRPALANDVSVANHIESPETSKSSVMPVHPGAAAYYEGAVLTFFERYGDWFYLVIMVLSIAGSGFAAMASSAASRARARNMMLLSELLAIVRAAHACTSEAELDRLERQADEILAAALVKAGHGHIDNAGVAAFTLGLDQARRAISERRQALGVAPSLSRAAE